MKGEEKVQTWTQDSKPEGTHSSTQAGAPSAKEQLLYKGPEEQKNSEEKLWSWDTPPSSYTTTPELPSAAGVRLIWSQPREKQNYTYTSYK